MSDFTATKNKIIQLCLELTTTVQQVCGGARLPVDTKQLLLDLLEMWPSSLSLKP